MTKLEMLEVVSKEAAKCEKCPELVCGRQKVVFGEGNPNTKVMLVGEAPGQSEAEQGRPFVGKAGILLRNIIKALGWQPEQVYIANILKCRPPGNRTPSKKEAANCRPFLDLQIKIVNPQYIVCLGATAAQNLLNTEATISSMRGKFYDYGQRKVLATYHPSYALRTGKTGKDAIWADLQILIKEMNKAS